MLVGEKVNTHTHTHTHTEREREREREKPRKRGYEICREWEIWDRVARKQLTEMIFKSSFDEEKWDIRHLAIWGRSIQGTK
jgi:hypothetical protein